TRSSSADYATSRTIKCRSSAAAAATTNCSSYSARWQLEATYNLSQCARSADGTAYSADRSTWSGAAHSNACNYYWTAAARSITTNTATMVSCTASASCLSAGFS